MSVFEFLFSLCLLAAFVAVRWLRDWPTDRDVDLHRMSDQWRGEREFTTLRRAK